MKKFLFVLAAITALASLATALWARPFTINCPYDGESMTFDHQVGFGPSAVCWYKHTTLDASSYPAHRVTHEAYVACGE